MPRRDPSWTDIQCGASVTKSEMSGKEVWVGWVHDGRRLTQLNPRVTRQAALDDALAHKERLLKPEMPTKVWTPGP